MTWYLDSIATIMIWFGLGLQISFAILSQWRLGLLSLFLVLVGMLIRYGGLYDERLFVFIIMTIFGILLYRKLPPGV